MQGKFYAFKLPITACTQTDSSQFRQIPDNQEVFVDMDTQQSLIFELLEQVEANNTEAAK
jgi:hypothetical protein